MKPFVVGATLFPAHLCLIRNRSCLHRQPGSTMCDKHTHTCAVCAGYCSGEFLTSVPLLMIQESDVGTLLCNCGPHKKVEARDMPNDFSSSPAKPCASQTLQLRSRFDGLFSAHGAHGHTHTNTPPVHFDGGTGHLDLRLFSCET